VDAVLVHLHRRSPVKKIPTLFVRSSDNRKYVTGIVNPVCAEVVENPISWHATRKWDGTCVMFDDSHWWARREVKPGKNPPPGWMHEDTDTFTGKQMGWEPIEQSSFYQFHLEALEHEDPERGVAEWGEGTYELVGPKINGNPEHAPHHQLVLHAAATAYTVPYRSYEGIKNALAQYPEIEGFVFHGPNGRMAKIKRRDFYWPPQ
jgi:hypothetical protein